MLFTISMLISLGFTNFDVTFKYSFQLAMLGAMLFFFCWKRTSFEKQKITLIALIIKINWYFNVYIEVINRLLSEELIRHFILPLDLFHIIIEIILLYFSGPAISVELIHVWNKFINYNDFELIKSIAVSVLSIFSY